MPEKNVVYYFGDYELRAGQGLRKSGKTSTLERQAVFVLQCLVEREGKWMSKEDIIKCAWDFGPKFVPRKNTFFHNKITDIRKEFGDDAIEFKSGYGYRFLPEILRREEIDEPPRRASHAALDSQGRRPGAGRISCARQPL
jgi:DNA-binding winged helix-turn-helix (wHTH) protein